MKASLCCRLVLILLAGMAPACATAADALAAWRDEAAATRKLADNDAPRAYVQAQRLQAELPATATPADRVLALNLLARSELYLAQTALVAEHARQAKDQATRSGDRVGEAEAELTIALNSIDAARIDAMVAAASHALALLDGVDRPDLIGEALLQTAMAYLRTGRFEESVTLSMQAMDIARRSKEPLALAYAHQGLALASAQSHRHKEAGEHYGQMRRHARAAGSKVMEASAFLGLGGAAAELGDLRAGERLVREALKLSREFAGPFYIAHGVFALADNLRRQGRFAESQLLLDEVLDIYARHPNKIGQWWTLNARSENDASLGRAAAARTDGERALALAEEIGLPLYRAESARRMAAIHAAAGDHRRAYRFSVEAAEMSAAAKRARTGERMVELAQRYQSESRQRKIDELSSRNRLQAAELGQHELERRWLATVLGGSLVMLIGVGVVLRRQLRAKAQIRALNADLERRVQERTAELRQQARYLRTLIDTLPLSIWLKDTQGRFLAVNRAAAAAFGRAPEETIGKSDAQLLPPALAQASFHHDLVVMTTRRQRCVEAQPDGAGEAVWLETCKAPVLDEDNSVLGTVGFARDISAQKAALAEARQLAQMRSEFMARISHELRTPLNGILGYAQLLKQDGTMTDQQIARLEIIERSGDHLLALIDDIIRQVGVDAERLDLAAAATSPAVPPAVSATAASSAPLLAPPPAELEMLHELARRGNMAKIARYAAHLTELGERYRPFAERVRHLATAYQSQAIVSLVEQYMEIRAES